MCELFIFDDYYLFLCVKISEFDDIIIMQDKLLFKHDHKKYNLYVRSYNRIKGFIFHFDILN